MSAMKSAMSGSPMLEGSITTFTRDTVEQPVDWSHVVLRILIFPFTLPFLARSLLAGRRKPRPTMVVNIMRIARLSDGAIIEAHFEGDFTASIPSLGDHVSLWGSYRNGVLIVKRAYNHSTGAQISVRRPGMLWLSRVAAIILPPIAVILLIIFAPLIPALFSAAGTLLITGIVIYCLIIVFLPWIPKRVVPFIVGFFLLYAILSLCAHVGSSTHP